MKSIYRWNTELGKDGAMLEFSSDYGNTWNRIGRVGSGANWYNHDAVSALSHDEDEEPGNNSQDTNYI
jgi:hypothetical protein